MCAYGAAGAGLRRATRRSSDLGVVVVAVMGGTFGVTVMGGIVTLGNDGANLGGETGRCFNASVGTCCCGWSVAC